MNQKSMRNVYISGGVRTPFVKSFTYYSGVTSQELMTEVLKHLVTQFSLQGQKLGDVALGAVMTNPSDWNLARESVLGSGLHPDTPAYNVQRACGTSLETANQVALKIASGQIDVGIAGGVDTNSDVPAVYPRSFAQKMFALKGAKSKLAMLEVIAKMRPSDFKPIFPDVVEPRTGLSMGQHTEKMVQEWGISREAQDELALQSHLNSAKAYEQGFYKDLVFEFKGVKQDPLVRKDTSLEKLAKLKPAFDFSGKGSLTAGNSSPLTDGAAATLLTSSEYAEAHGLPLLARLVDVQATALDFVGGAGLLMAPAQAVATLLNRNGLKLQDFDFYEIHEAFAGQVLCTLKAWESEQYCKEVLGLSGALGGIDRSKMNIKGGSVALGHPFAATGARIVVSLAKMLSQSQKPARGLISICTAGGMGVAAILETVSSKQ